MKYIDEFRDGKLARDLVQAIKQAVSPGRCYNFMEFCGGHTHAIARYGIEDLLPLTVRMIHGPGCPVCVLPVRRLDIAIRLVCEQNIILCTYADMMRVPGSDGLNLLQARANGADVRMVYSISDALAIAEKNPNCEVVFFAIGFETTTPPTALAIKQAHAKNLRNFSIFCNHVLTPAAIVNILESSEMRDLGKPSLDGFIGPAHVSTVIGSAPYEFFAKEYRKPVVIAGFEPLDVLQGVLMLVTQVNEGRFDVENEYIRAVSRHGNEKAKSLVAEVFELRKSFEWRGLGRVPYSALKLKKNYAQWDTENRFKVPDGKTVEHKSCECGAILRGVKKPVDCKLFGTACTPETPMGSCMVSSEGSCAAYYSYGRFKDVRQQHENQKIRQGISV